LGQIKTKKRFSKEVDERITEHLMMLYWTGKITLEDEILKQFYATASEDLRYMALDFVGRTFRKNEGEIPSAIIERVQRLWENRLAVIKNSHVVASKELNGFGWWFTSGIFPEKWSMENLLEALKLAEKMYPDTQVIESLESFVPTMPEQVIEAISLLVDGDKEGWRVLHSKETIRKIIEEINKTHNQQAKEKAKELANKLITKGFVDDYKDLV